MKKLLIVESPNKIKTISKFLDKSFKVMSTVGHIKDLPPKKIGVEIDKKGQVSIEYEVMENKEKVISDIVKEAQKCDTIFLAPDPDREGEIIAWHIGQEIEKANKNNSNIQRITFNEITKEAITNAVNNPGEINLEKVKAQQARRVLDRWVGYEVSPILWRKISRGLSAGRVQSVALRLICDRELEIINFKAEEYWSIEALFNSDKSKFASQLSKINNKKLDLKSKKDTDKVLEELKTSDFTVSKIEDKKRLSNPLPPFMTSTLQQAAYNRLGFSVKKTMQLAQSLYEGLPLENSKEPVALITYMRTDSLRIADSAIKATREFIEDNYSKEYLPTKAKIYTKAGKAAQDAHEAVRPIKTIVTPTIVNKYAPKDVAKLYNLIWQRFVASQMNPAQYAQRTVTILGENSNNKNIYEFRITGSSLIFDGFLKVYNTEEDSKDKKVKIPKELKAKDKLNLDKLSPKQHFTQPPPRYSEATLVKELYKEGIGRPSTYVAIMNTIRARSYTTLNEAKRFMPTELGIAVTKLLVDNLPHIMNPKFTAHMEEDLDKIAQGELRRDKLLDDFYKTFQDDLDKFKVSSTKAAQSTDIKCPDCKEQNLVVKFSKNGEFLGCPGYPECKFTNNFTKEEDGSIKLADKRPEPELLDEDCPKCKVNKLRKLIGKFGPFTACSGYPTCKYIPETKAGVSCPKCKTGDLIKRMWRGGSFWGCNQYPKCQLAVFGDPVEKDCPSCGLSVLAKKVNKDGEDVFSCPSKTCKYTTGKVITKKAATTKTKASAAKTKKPAAKK